jgi:hypothetical protein
VAVAGSGRIFTDDAKRNHRAPLNQRVSHASFDSVRGRIFGVVVHNRLRVMNNDVPCVFLRRGKYNTEVVGHGRVLVAPVLYPVGSVVRRR